MPARFFQTLLNYLPRRARATKVRSSAKSRRALNYEHLEDRRLLAGDALEQRFDFGTTSSPVDPATRV